MKCTIPKECENCLLNRNASGDYPCEMHKICVNGCHGLFKPLPELVHKLKWINFNPFNKRERLCADWKIGRFEVRKSKDNQFYFVLLDKDKKVLMRSETYQKVISCTKGINSFTLNIKKPYSVEVFKDVDGKYRIRVKATNHKILASTAKGYPLDKISEIEHNIINLVAEAQIVIMCNTNNILIME